MLTQFFMKQLRKNNSPKLPLLWGGLGWGFNSTIQQFNNSTKLPLLWGGLGRGINSTNQRLIFLQTL
jgi:hypothetical protein